MSFYEHSLAASWPNVRQKPAQSKGGGSDQGGPYRWDRAFEFESLPQPIEASTPPQHNREAVNGAFGSQLDEVEKAMDVLLKGAKPFRRYDLQQQQQQQQPPPYFNGGKRRTFPSAPRHEGYAKVSGMAVATTAAVGGGAGAGMGAGPLGKQQQQQHMGIGTIGQKEDRKDEHWRTWQTGMSSARSAQGVWG